MAECGIEVQAGICRPHTTSQSQRMKIGYATGIRLLTKEGNQRPRKLPKCRPSNSGMNSTAALPAFGSCPRVLAPRALHRSAMSFFISPFESILRSLKCACPTEAGTLNMAFNVIYLQLGGTGLEPVTPSVSCTPGLTFKTSIGALIFGAFRPILSLSQTIAMPIIFSQVYVVLGEFSGRRVVTLACYVSPSRW